MDSITKQVVATAALPQTVYASHNLQTIQLPITADKMPATVDVVRRTTGGIRFREDGPWGDRGVQEVLVACFEHVEQRVIARFKPFF